MNNILKFIYVFSFILICSMFFLFNGVKANTRLEIRGIEDVQKFVNYKISNGEFNFEFSAFAKINDKNYRNLLSGTQCESILLGLGQISQFHSIVFSCPYKTTEMSNSASFDYNVKSYITFEEYKKLKSYVEIESKKMLKVTTDQDKLVEMVITHTYRDWSDFWYFYNYSTSDAITLVSSLFFQHLGIEHQIVNGRASTGGTFLSNLIKIDDNRFHCAYHKELCFLTDSEIGTYFTWNYSKYPKADKKYIRNESQTKSLYTEIVKLEDPKITEIVVESDSIDETIVGNASSWAIDGIISADKRGLVPTSFDKDYKRNITRAEFTWLIVKLYEYKTGDVVYNYQSNNPKVI